MHNVFIIKLFVFMLLVLVTSSWLIPVHRTVPLVDRQNPSTRAISVLPDPFVLLLEVKITQSRCLKVFFFTSLLVYGLFTNLMIHATMIFKKNVSGPPFKWKMTKTEHQRFVQSVRYSPNGDHFATGGFDGKIFIYDGKTSDLIGELGSIDL